MHVDHLKDRFHQSLHHSARAASDKHPLKKLTEEQFEEVTVVMMAVLGEVLAEVAVVVADLASRVEVLETGAKST